MATPCRLWSLTACGHRCLAVSNECPHPFPSWGFEKRPWVVIVFHFHAKDLSSSLLLTFNFWNWSRQLNFFRLEKNSSHLLVRWSSAPHCGCSVLLDCQGFWVLLWLPTATALGCCLLFLVFLSAAEPFLSAQRAATAICSGATIVWSSMAESSCSGCCKCSGRCRGLMEICPCRAVQLETTCLMSVF